METTLKKIAEDIIHLCAKGQLMKAFGLYSGENFMHHNPFYPGDGKSLMMAMEK